ncbi:(2,3-dihydroxybenzoyl)adenylate synthase [Azohydromonas caseinilytica]|uniref:AMP-binding protein n=1 Tax=Azohydromonas caseinilytica TaxID=2728836 RepID=A0A848FDK3_9BURK|nr:AMP-binding protein [Azohydromonas caseinilytica]NML16469.1 AMP-binding protein [Azohydromonas caseinilytica]
MIEGFVPFPAELAQRYRERGYWQDRSLAQEFAAVFEKYAPRTALIDGERRYSYADVDALSDNLALNLLDLGLQPRDRVVPTLPNVAEFVILYFALQKIGAIPIAALVTHRFAEISQFTQLAQARCCVYPEAVGDFRFGPVIDRVQAANPCLQLRLVLGQPGPGEHSLTDLIERPATRDRQALRALDIDPCDPCIFQLSGGTTGIPKLIPRTNNDYAYNSKVAADVAGVDAESVLLLVLPIAHNLPLACPGIQGFMFKGATVVLHANTRPAEMFALMQKHGVTHLKVVPALLVRLINDPAIGDFDLSSVQQIQSGGQRMQPEVRLRTRQLFQKAFVQENFGMSEGVLMFVRRGDPEEVLLETCGRPVCPDDEVKLIDDEGREVPDGEVGELACRGPYTLRGYWGVPEYNARQFTADGFYRSGDLMRKHASGNYIVEGRKKDLINRGGEKISAEEVENLILMHPAVQNVACVPMPDAALGERMCACVIPKRGASLSLAELVSFLLTHEIAKFKLPERLELLPDFPVSTFGKVSKKALGEMVAVKVAREAGAAQAA